MASGGSDHFGRYQKFDVIILASRAFVRTKTKFARRIKIPLCLFACWDAIPNPCYHHDSVMAAHSCGVLKERFAKTRSLHRHDAEQWVWAAPNKPLATQVVFVYTKTLLARQLRCSRMVPRSTACKSDCVSPNCQFLLQLLYWSHQKFFRRQLP